MDKELIREIATQIINDKILLNWEFYLLMFLISIVSYAVGSFIKSYVAKRGETLARKSDLDAIITELRKTTEVTEAIKSQIDKEAWITKEYNILRRQKLEELLTGINKYVGNIQFDVVKILQKGDLYEDISNPLYRAKMLHILYFPELNNEMKEFFSAKIKFNDWLLEGVKDKSKKSDPEYWKRQQELLKSMVEVLGKVESKSVSVMESIWKL